MQNSVLHKESSFPSGPALIRYTTLFCLELSSQKAAAINLCGGRVGEFLTSDHLKYTAAVRYQLTSCRSRPPW